MTSIILCHDLASLKSGLPSPTELLRYLILRESQTSLNIRAYLRQRGQSHELPRADLFRQQATWFRSAYVEALGRLNADQASRDWWTKPFTTKNPISTELCRDIFIFLLIAALAREADSALVVITDNRLLAEQVAAWGKAEGVAVINAVDSTQTLRQFGSSFYYPALFVRVISLLGFRLWTWLTGLDRAIVDKEAGVLIATVVHRHSFTPEGWFQDTYFGKLGEWLVGQGIHVVTAGIIDDRLNRKLARAFTRENGGPPKVIFDAGIRVRDIFRCVWEAIRAYRADCSRNLTVIVRGLNVGYLITQALRQAHTSGNVLWSLYTFHSARRLAALFPNKRSIHPYENRAFEKMMLLGFRETSRKHRVGYQHASITASHTNFIFADKEVDVTPLPDVVVTMGQVTRDWLVNEGHHPPSLLKIGCALRQQGAGGSGHLRRRPSKLTRILVALATSLAEHVQTLMFLQKALRNDNIRELRIRPHPTIRLGDALALLPDEQTQLQFTVSRGSVAEDLAWADVVLYASSTIGLETVSAGVPAMYVDLGDILDTDPMGGWTEFKWTVRQPEDLSAVLAEIEGLTDAQYQTRQQYGIAYAQSYIYPVTEQHLRAFCEG